MKSLLRSIGLLACALIAQSAWAQSDIIIGQSAALSGPAQALGTEMRDGALLYFDQINANGGVNGRKIVLKSLDDGYEPARAAANTKQLIEKEGAFALFGYVGTPTSAAALPIFTEAKVPFVAPFTGAQLLREPFNRNIFNVRASYYDETELIVRHLTDLKIDRIAVFHQNDSYGQAGLAGVERAIKARNISIVAKGTVERNTVDVAAAVNAIKGANPQAVVMISAYKSCAAFITEMKRAGSQPTFWNVSFVGSKALSDELGYSGRGVNISQVVPFPWDESVAVVREYRKAIAAKKMEASFTSLEGYIGAKVLVEGMRRAGKNLTRDGLVNALESMNNYDAGGFRVSFGPNDHNASELVDLTIITKEGRFLR